MSPPSWRPKFHLPAPVSFVGAFGCFAVMFMINAGATFVAGFVVLSVYLMMEKRSLATRWGDMRSGILMLIARNAIYALTRRPPDEHTWKPNILVMAGAPTSRWYLVELAAAFSHEFSFLTVASVLPQDTDPNRINNISQAVADYLDKHKVAAISKVYSAESPLVGACELAKAYGYGPLVPNTVMLGLSENPDNFHDMARLVIQAHSHRQNLVLIRDAGGENDTFNRRERIDLWWYGSQQNLGFMLAVVNLMTKGADWKNAGFSIKSIVKTEDEIPAVKERIEQFISKARVDAEAEVFLQKPPNVFENIKNYSQGADLVMLGFRAPGADESVDEYAAYYAQSLKRMEGLPPAALVLASESIDFLSIFH